MTNTRAESLMSIAENPNLRIHERIAQIKGDDKKISSISEAKAIIAIPDGDVVFTDNQDTLPMAKKQAFNYLEEQQKAKENNKKIVEQNSNPLNFLNDIYKNYQKVQRTINDVEKLVKSTPRFNFIY